MNTSIIIWCITALIFALILVIELVKHSSSHKAHNSLRHIPLFGVGTESEEIYVPGDIKPGTENYYDDDLSDF